ncbi:MAG TPA: hypothetical protein VHE30_01505 [Polyangiaceae bacterium]|nr:hypothetical protein [Polyangiaceae bacterium]
MTKKIRTRTPRREKPATNPAAEAPPTPLELEAVLGRTRFKASEVEYPVDRAKGALDDLSDELRSVSERVAHEIHDLDHHGYEGARLRADALQSFAISLAELSVRLMRQAGRLEAFAECTDAAGRGVAMADRIRDGKLSGWRGLLAAGGGS